jgi:hypothetical protein
MKRNNPYINTTFFKLTGLPVELMFDILNRFPFKDAIALMQTSTEMKEYIQNENIWKGFGANNFEDFVIRVKELPKRYKSLVIKNNYPLLIAEEIVNVLALPREQRIGKYLTPEQIIDTPASQMLSLQFWFAKEPCIVMLCEKLISLEQIVRMSTGQIIQLNDICVIALRKNLVSPEQLISLSVNHIICLFDNEKKIAALDEKLISLEQLSNMSTDHILCLFGNEKGITALREKMISPEQIASMSVAHVRFLFNYDHCFVGLREKLFTPEEFAKVPVEKISFFIRDKIKLLDMDVEIEKPGYPRKF